jgi:hypothetical protein
MSGTAFKCGRCAGAGRLLIDISPDGEAPKSYIEKPCDMCNGERMISKAQLITQTADITLDESEFLPIPLVGAFRCYIDGKIAQRKMTSRQLYRLAQYALDAAVETQSYEYKRDSNIEGSSDKNSGR